MVSIRPIMSASTVPVAFFILAANSAAASGAILSSTARLAAASPTPPRMDASDMSKALSVDIMLRKSAVVPGILSPSFIASALTCPNAPTMPFLSIITVFSRTDASSSSAYAAIGLLIA